MIKKFIKNLFINLLLILIAVIVYFLLGGILWLLESYFGKIIGVSVWGIILCVAWTLFFTYYDTKKETKDEDEK